MENYREPFSESYRESEASNVILSFYERDPGMSTISFYPFNNLHRVLMFPFIDQKSERQQAKGTCLQFRS